MQDDQASQRQIFERAARELGVDLDEDKLKEALRKMGPPPPDWPENQIEEEGDPNNPAAT